MDKELKNTNVEQMQKLVESLIAQRNAAILLLGKTSDVEDVVRLCKFVVFVQSQINDVSERQSLAKLIVDVE